MLFKNLKFLFLIALAVPVSVHADPEGTDIIISYPIQLKKKQDVFKNLVKDNMPGKTRDDYHVTLGLVTDVDKKDAGKLDRHLRNIARTYFDKNMTFTATAAKKYLVNRAANNSPIVLTPKVDEATKLKSVNRILHEALQKYNQQKGTNYEFHADLLPPVYDPHVSVATRRDIQDLNLNRDTVIANLNAALGQNSLELLQFEKDPAFKKNQGPKRKYGPQFRRKRFERGPRFRKNNFKRKHFPNRRRNRR
jgi:2'-5' RNA ligase